MTVSFNHRWGLNLVTWDFEEEFGRTDMYSQLLHYYGPRGKKNTINDEADYVVRSYHAYNPIEDNYSLIYCDWKNSNLLSVHLDFNGEDVSNSYDELGKCSMTPMLILNSGWGEYLAVWWAQINGSVRIYIRRLDRNGLPITESGRRISFWREHPLAINVLYSTSPRGAYNPVLNQYLLVWQRGNEVWGRLIEADGTPRAASIRISEGGSPDVIFSANKNEYIVVYDRAGDIFGALVDNDSNVTRTFQISESLKTDKTPRIAYDSARDEALAVWVHEYEYLDNDIMGRIITSTCALR